MGLRTPTTGPNRRRADSQTQQKLARRTEANLTMRMKMRRDKFIAALLLGFGHRDAALAAGVSFKQAGKEASRMLAEPYVHETFRKLRESMSEEDLLTKKELSLNVKGIAFSAFINANARVQASALLARLFGFEAPQKSLSVSGVMMVPVQRSVDKWEEEAVNSQAQLLAEVRS